MLLSLFGLAAFFITQQEESQEAQWTAANIKPFKNWFQIDWQKQAIGWASIELIRNDSQISILEEEFITGRVQSQLMEFSYKRQLNFSAQAPYALKSVRIESIEPGLEVVKEIINQSELQAIQTRNGKATQSNHQRADYSLTDYLAVHVWLEALEEHSKALFSKEFNNDDFGIHYSRYELLNLPTDKTPYYQVKHQLQNSADPNEDYQSQATLLRFSKGFRLLRSLRVNGMTKIASEGKVTINPEMQRDLYIASGIKVDRSLGEAREIKQLQLMIPHEFLADFRNHPALKLQQNKLTLERGYQYQAVTEPSVTNAHPRAATLAQSLIGGLKRDDQQIKLLMEYVHEAIRYQTLPASFEVDDILDNRIGDCTEHALLLTEMLNGVGIPARQVSGLIYLGDEKQRFGGHVWVEAYSEGKWQSVDPTWNQYQVSATHIPLMIGADKSPQILQKAIDLTFEVGFVR